MTSPSSSDRSGRPSIYWGSDSESESPQRPALADHSSNPPRPRLSSPRLFQDFFSNTTRANARLPPAAPQENRATLQEFPQAFENVNRAIQTAHQAFQNTPVVDLTDSPPRRQASLTSSATGQRVRRESPTYDRSPSPPYSPASNPRWRPDEATREMQPSRNVSATGERAAKRRRIVHTLDGSDEEEPQTRPSTLEEVEAVDLTEVNTDADLSKALSKQRQDAIQAQMKQNQGGEPAGRTPLSSYKCPICMDTPEDATTTTCGHLFCHKCIIDTLRWSEEQRQDEYMHGKNAKGTCPVCRKQLARIDKPGLKRTLIPLELKLITRKRIDVKGKGVVKQDVGLHSKTSKIAKSERENSAAMWDDLTAF